MDPQDAFAVARGIFDHELASLIYSSTSTSSPTTNLQRIAATSPPSPPQANVVIPHKRSASSPSSEYGMHKRPKVKVASDLATPSSGAPYTPPLDMELESRSVSPSSALTKNLPEKTANGRDLLTGSKGQDGEDGHSLHVHPSRRVLLDRPHGSKSRSAHSSSSPAEHPADSSEMDAHKRSRTPRIDCAPRQSPTPRIDSAPGQSRASFKPNSSKTWTTQRNAVRRQWDVRKSDMAYEDLLRLRRNEKAENVDRYVPDHFNTEAALREPKPARAFPFTLPWNKVIADVAQMQNDMRPFHFALEERAAKTRKDRAPCRALTTGLLRKSRSVSREAARVFYSHNTFWFPWPTTAWMQLESFLATIGPLHTSHLRKLRVHAPLWHRGPQEDYAEGAILDLTSPASRFAVMKPPARDRLLAAIRSSVRHLCPNPGPNPSTALAQLTLDLEHGPMADLWAGRCPSETSLITVSQAEEYIARQRHGVELLRTLSRGMTERPSLHVYYTTGKPHNLEIRGLREHLPALRAEAAKYGWDVDGTLRQKRGS
ncbi:hypothetical protein Tdes44962_MAKER00945 [Teratosphaeria destructans]|uniref:Uncharacterized protein n=1 Tax=Teratosphaeria destructans TaxID=418781 RepID=A0A9W7SJD2_9PEZI|nr:hypothetical protein Tdes44962_MAKER00945 [Teratosphaeria destructans]